MREPISTAYVPTKKKKKTTTPTPPPGFRGLGGTFTPGGFVPRKPKVVAPPDQAPYRHGQSPAQQGATALAAGGEVTLVQPAHAQRAAQTMAVQRMLNKKGARLAVDGQWGPNTESAYQAFLHHAATYTKQSQPLDATRDPGYLAGPHALTAHERLLIAQQERERAAMANSPQARPAQTTFSDVRRHQPRFAGEPVAGWEGALGPNGTPIERPYYTDAATHEHTRGQVAAAQDDTLFRARFGDQTAQDIQDTPHLNPAFQGAVEGIGSMLPGVALAQGHGLKREIINDLLWLGPSEIAAPFKITRGVVEATRAGTDIKTAARAAVTAWREKRLARVQNPIIQRDMQSSPDRASFIAAIREVPKLSGTEMHALLQVADHNALTRAAQTGEKPSVAWGKANFGESTFHDINPTRDEALGVLAQTGDAHFQQAPLTQFPERGAWDTGGGLKNWMGPKGYMGVPFVSKLHALVFDMPAKVGVDELLGKIKSAGIKQDEIRWNRFDEFLKVATEKGQKSITREEALGWLDSNYLKIEENRRFQKNTDPYATSRGGVDSNDTIFGQYTIPGGDDANYQEFTIRLPSDEYGHLYSYTGHFPDANILAHVRATDRIVADDKTLMIEEIQSDWHQAGQKQGYKVPVEEHPEFPERTKAVEQAQADIDAIEKRIRQTITDSVFNHPTLPAFPEALRPAFERGGETSIGLNLKDSAGLRDWGEKLRLIEDELKANPDATIDVRDVAPRQHTPYDDRAGFDVAINGRRIDGPWLQNSYDMAGTAEKTAGNAALNWNHVLAMRPAERDALISQTSALEHALRERSTSIRLLNELHQFAERGVSQAPFAKTWHELAFKRMLAEAVDKGYDRIAWTTGRTQAERYNLARFFKRIEIKQGKSYSGDYSDALYSWASERARWSADDMDEEMLGFTDETEQRLREQAGEYEDYPNEDQFYMIDTPDGEVSAPADQEGAWLNEHAYDNAVDEYLSAVDDRFDTLKEEWISEAREAQYESELDHYLENSDEFDDAPSSGNLVVSALDHNGQWHDYTASTDSSEENALENVVGPDIAQRYYESGETKFEGDNLVAGENAKSALGAAHFYDNKLTGFVNKFLKKTGVQSTMEEIGKRKGAFSYRLRFKTNYSTEPGFEHGLPRGGSWVLEGNADHPYGDYFQAVNAQHDRFGDLPKAEVTRENSGYAGSRYSNIWVKWSDFPAGSERSNLATAGHGYTYSGWGNEIWGPFDSREEAANYVERTLEHKSREWSSAAGAGTVVHSIPVTDEVRKFVDQGIVLFQRDPLVKDIKKAQGVTRVKGAVELGGDKAKLHLFAAADASTVVHELGHVIQQRIPELRPLDPETVARSVERFFMTAKAPTESLKLPFAEIDQALRRVYGTPDKIPGAVRQPAITRALTDFFKGAEKDHPDVHHAVANMFFQTDAMMQAATAQAQMLTASGVHPDEAARLTAEMFKVDEAALRKAMEDTTQHERIHSNAQLDERYGAAETTESAEDIMRRNGLGGDTHFQEGDSFGDAAKRELESYGAMARDAGRTLPKAQWPPWVRNQLRDQGLLDADGNFNSAAYFAKYGTTEGERTPIQPTSRAEADSFIEELKRRNRSPIDPLNPANSADLGRAMGELDKQTQTPDTFPEDWTHFQEGPPEEPIQEDSLARTFEPASEKTPEEILRSGMKGVPLRRSLQNQARSEEKSRRSAAYEQALRGGEGLEGHKQALHTLKGELPKIDHGGFKELTPEALDHLVNVVRDHPHLMPYQKARLIEGLDKATRGELPTASEQVLIEHVFGKDTARGLKEIATLPKHIQNLIAEVLNVPRSVMASFDLSAPFRQGLVIGTRHPVIFARNFGAMIKSFGSERIYQEVQNEVRARPTFPMMHEARLAVTDMESLDAREEQFYSNLAERLTGGFSFKGGFHATPERSPIRMSGRAYTAFLVKTRADVFDHLIRVAESQGRNVQDEKFLHDLGRYINAATGRGTLGALQGAAPLLNTVFFSPRLLASRIDLLFSPITYARADPFVRKQALVSMLHLVGVAGTILGLVSLLPGVSVDFLEPRSADFGKIKIGNTRIDILGGFQQPIRLISQYLSGTIISSTTGERLVLGPQGPGAVSRKDIVERFFEGKLAPVPSIINDWNKGTDFQGQPFSWKKEAYSHMLPLLAQDSADLYSAPEGGLPNGILAAVGGYALGAFGLGIQTYGPKNPGQKPTSKLQSEAKKAGMPPPTKAILIDVDHKAHLDSLSQKHVGDPQAKLDAYIKYYAETTGDHSFDKWIGKKLPDDAAQAGADNIRAAMVGAGLSQYEAAIKASLKAQGKKP